MVLENNIQLNVQNTGQRRDKVNETEYQVSVKGMVFSEISKVQKRDHCIMIIII